MPAAAGTGEPPPLTECAAPTRPEQLPHALTFFLNAGQRQAVLKALQRHHARRVDALLRALGIEQD
ncbi:MAG: hypothetical protein DYG94_07030 [Leptolyngbya sp. PLA3]|nr:MAG: hypothetical protein EDM82_06375 [Cyanobacteria bacterium CYA]MCE7968482.1 hypothetical protein [Leptolyngbya sp. PL-A3]